MAKDPDQIQKSRSSQISYFVITPPLESKTMEEEDFAECMDYIHIWESATSRKHRQNKQQLF